MSWRQSGAMLWWEGRMRALLLILMVLAVVPYKLKCAGTHIGRVLVRAKGTFDIRTKQERVKDVPHRYCRPIHRNDGYSYQQGAQHSSPA